MSGIIENMPVEERLERLKALAQLLMDIVGQRGSMLLSDALDYVAAALRTAVSQIKQGLNYALSNSLLRLDADDNLSVA